MLMGGLSRPAKVVGYSKNAPFNGGIGYILCEEIMTPLQKTRWKPRLWKEPLPDFLKMMLK